MIKFKNIFIFMIFSFILTIVQIKGSENIEDLEPLSLEECIKIALENNLLIDIAEGDLEISSAGVMEAKSKKYPSIKIGGSISQYTYQTGFCNVTLAEPLPGVSEFPSMSLEREDWDAELFLEIEQLIYDGGRTGIDITRAKLEQENYKIKLTLAKEEIKYKSQLAFYSTLKAREKLKLSEENVKNGEEHIKLAEALFQEGLVPEVDAITAAVALSRAQMLCNQAKNEYDKSTGNLNLIMGRDINNPVNLTGNITYEPLELNEELISEKALLERIEVKQLDLASSEEQFNVAQASFAPTISAHAGYILRDEDSMGRKNFYVGLGINFPVFNIPEYKAKVEKAEALIEQGKAQKELLKNQIKLEVHNALLDLESIQENAELAGKEVELAMLSVEIAEGKYKEGVGTILELTNSQLNLLKAQTDYLDSVYNHKMAIATLEYVTGCDMEELIGNE